MKFNQKIYLIPAAKYDKLVKDNQTKNQQTSPENSSDKKAPENTSNKQTDGETPNSSDFFQNEIEKAEKIPSPRVETSENSEGKVGEYSQNFSFKDHEHPDFKKNFHFNGQNTEKNQVIFPPPGIPEKNIKITRKQRKTKPDFSSPQQQSEKNKQSHREKQNKSENLKTTDTKKRKISQSSPPKQKYITEPQAKKQKISDISKTFNWVSLK